ncbi:MAG: DUF4270 family protein [Sphingobacteriales bacterium]
MKFFRIDLLTLLISLFILNSCKNQDTAGFTLGTKGNLSGSVVDTATVFTKTVAEDSVVTSGIASCPLGYINDPIFGTTQSDLITDLNLPGSAAYTLPAGTITIDSAVLILRYNKGFYGDSLNSRYTLNVYQLPKRQADGATYYNFTTWGNPSVLLGTKTFSPRPNTHVVIDNAVTGKAPVPDTVGAQIRIPISQSFIRSSLFGASNAQLNSNLIFKNNVKGLYITIDKNQSTGEGGTMMVSGIDSIAVYIRAASGTVIDTSIVYLPTTQHASYINMVRSPALQNALNNKTSVTDSIVYLQGLAGSRVKVSFPYLDSLFSNRNVGGVNNVIINRAELVVTAILPPGSSDLPGYLAPLPRLSLYELDIAHQRVELPDASGLSTPDGVGAFGGFFLPNLKPANTYHFLVTSYIQNRIMNKLTDYGTYLAPIDITNTTSVDITPSAQAAARTVAGGGYVNALGAKNPSYSMKLNVIYTRIHK